MKTLITGTKGYIASSFASHYKNSQLIDVRDDSWRDFSFSGFDTVLHTAGLVHKRETRLNQYDYYIINRDLTEAVAKKAKDDGVRQFVFLSSISVYGITSGVITADTVPVPKTHYGRSKLAAESLLMQLVDDDFKIAILRPPMVYGPGSPGNYSKLCRLANIMPFFPDYPNKRSMISIGNLCAYIQDVIENERAGLFFPQDPELVSTTDMVLSIKNIRTTRALNWLISLLMPIGVVSKMFGDLIIEYSLFYP